MPDNMESSVLLLIIVGVVGAIVLIADAVIFIRWVRYKWAKYDLQERRFREANERASQSETASESDPVFEMGDDPEMPPYPFARTWSLIDPFLGFQAVYLAGNLVIGAAALPLLLHRGTLGGVDVLFSAPGIIIQTVGTLFLNGLFVGLAAYCVHRYRTSLAAIGLRRPTAWQIALGFGLGLVLFAIASGMEVGMDRVLPLLVPKAVLEALVKFNNDVTAGGFFSKIPTLQLKIVFALAGVVAAPIGEEVFFRGLLYNSLKRRLNIPAAITISGLLFALIHFGPLAIVAIFPMGMALAYVYEKTRSLWVTICMHATNNGLQFVLALAFPHLGEAPRQSVQPPPPPARPAAVRSVPAHSGPRRVPPRPGVHTHD
jgi:membrane protease YdiL (CAAX protease family)